MTAEEWNSLPADVLAENYNLKLFKARVRGFRGKKAQPISCIVTYYQEQENIIIVSVLGGAWLVMMVVIIVIVTQVSSLKRKVHEMQATGRIRVQKLKMVPDKNHSYQNPTLTPDEEMSRRGYSMYRAEDDLESGRGNERQTSGQFVEELSKELDSRHQRQSTTAPPFLLKAIQENKRMSSGQALANPVAKNKTRESVTNPNFIY